MIQPQISTVTGTTSSNASSVDTEDLPVNVIDLSEQVSPGTTLHIGRLFSDLERFAGQETYSYPYHPDPNGPHFQCSGPWCVHCGRHLSYDHCHWSIRLPCPVCFGECGTYATVCDCRVVMDRSYDGFDERGRTNTGSTSMLARSALLSLANLTASSSGHPSTLNRRR